MLAVSLHEAKQRFAELLVDIPQVVAVHVRLGDTDGMFVLLNHSHYDDQLMDILLDREQQLHEQIEQVPDIHYIPMMGQSQQEVVDMLSGMLFVW